MKFLDMNYLFAQGRDHSVDNINPDVLLCPKLDCGDFFWYPSSYISLIEVEEISKAHTNGFNHLIS